MSNSIRIVPDTNVWIAGALATGYAYNFLLTLDKTIPTYQIFTSQAILLELQQKLEKLGLNREKVVAYLAAAAEVAQIVQPIIKLQIVRDPDDDKILECAIEANAQIILSFDKDLLDLKNYEGIAIAHPRMLKHLFLHR